MCRRRRRECFMIRIVDGVVFVVGDAGGGEEEV